MGSPVARSRKLDSLDDRELARLATAGGGHAFAELYDRHERRVYGFCMRMLGSPHDAADATQETFVRLLGRLPSLEGRELNFAAYALTAARNACYDMIEGRRRVEPVAEQADGSPGGRHSSPDENLERDPERAALLAAAREDVRAANAELPARQREVLALREVELLSYDEIGELMGLNRNAVAQLVSRSRIKLRDLLRGSALASVSASSEDCARALPLLASIQDDEREDAAQLDWVRAHLATCDTCRLSQAAMQEAGISYRALAPIAPLLWLRHATIARAAEFVGANWSHIAGPSSVRQGPTGEQTPAHDSSSSAYGSAGNTADEQALQPVDARSNITAHSGSAKLARWGVVGVALLAMCLVLVTMTGITRDGHVSSQALPPDGAITQPATESTRVRQTHHAATALTIPKSVQPLAVHDAGSPAATLVTVPSKKAPTRRVANHRHPQKPPIRRAPTHRPAPPAATTPPSTTGTTPNPPTSTAPSTTTPPTQTTPPPTPPATSGSGETTETTTTSAPPEKPGLIP
ncbi:MAG TPA: sigma-70 family RNA polymerase sigma factor [Solirubrobacteraceae bacterium]|nr:sigma-70 family RNA polymerase sigma factor [Solirubrobacteraceae bacterium]